MKKCIVCGAELFSKSLISLKNMPESAECIEPGDISGKDKMIDMNLCQCSKCGLIQLDAEPVEYYKDCIRASGNSSSVHDMRVKEYQEFIDKFSLKGKKIIEIGCGAGEFLEILQSFPVQAYGVEHKKESVGFASKKCSNVENAWIGDKNFISSNGPYDAFVCHNFLEHQPDPNEFIEGIYRNTTDNAVGIIDVPGWFFFQENTAYFDIIHDHIAYYSEETLSFLLRKNGFEIVHSSIINRDTIHTFVQKIKREDVGNLNKAYQTICNEFDDLCNKYNKVALWGACHQGFVLAASAKHGNIAYFIDSSKRKQGMLSPGSHIKIIAPENFHNEPVDLIIITTSAGYTEEISKIITDKYGDVPRAAIEKGHIKMLEAKTHKFIQNTINKEKNNLAEVLPIDMPYMMFIDPCNACNFKCNFCAPQTEKNKVTFKHMSMKMDLYKKIIDDVSLFPRPLKMLRLYAMGEPLINPNFPEMVMYAKEKKVSEYIETVTNGSLLNPELNQRLSNSGIDRIRISIEGVEDEVYKKTCGVSININKLVDNIADLYEKTRNKVEIYIKTVDVAVDTEEKRTRFFNMFENICDKIFVESIAPVWPDFDELDTKYSYSGQKLMGGKADKSINCCPVIFYGLVVNPDGEVTPCCADWKRGYSYGNASQTPLNKIWANDRMKKMWVEMLKGNRNMFSSCRRCEYLNYVVNDNIDDATDKILNRINEKYKDSE